MAIIWKTACAELIQIYKCGIHITLRIASVESSILMTRESAVFYNFLHFFFFKTCSLIFYLFADSKYLLLKKSKILIVFINMSERKKKTALLNNTIQE